MRSRNANLARPCAFGPPMRRSLFPLLLLLGVLLPLSASSQALASKSKAPLIANAKAAAKLKAAFFAAPLGFEPNEGQTDARVKYLARGSGYTLFLTPTEAVFALRRAKEVSGQAKPLLPGKRSIGLQEKDKQRKAASAPPAILRMALVGANPAPQIAGLKPQAQRVNYFIGRDPKKWHSGIQTCAQVRYQDVYPGVSLLYYGNQRQLEYDFQVSPGADAQAIRLKFTGADKVAIDDQGNLALSIGKQTVAQHKPVIYQEIDGERQIIAGRYALDGAGEVGFAVDKYDHSRPLVIDPVLVYSTYLGGMMEDDVRFAVAGLSIAVDSSGCAYIAGTTSSPTFPITAGAFQTTTPYPGGILFTNFVSKLSADGSYLVYSTYLGGTGGDEEAKGIALDTAGEAYITGYTVSTDFPVTANAFQATNKTNGNQTGFVSKLSSDGSALIYSTYLGGSTAQFPGDYGTGIALDTSGNAYVTGYTSSTDFPVTSGAFQTNGTSFISKFSADGSSLVYSTYLDGAITTSIAVDTSSSAYVTGDASTNLPVTAGAFQTTMAAGSGPAFVSKISSDGTSLIYSTYLGGSSSQYDGDSGRGIAVDPAGYAFVTGNTNSSDFPVTPGAFQTTSPGASSAFISKLSADGSSLVYSTYLGGGNLYNGDYGNSIALDSAGNAYVAGDPGAFVTKISADGTFLHYSTFLGASGGAYGNGIAVDASGNAYVTGKTSSIDFPVTAGALQTTNNNDSGQTGFISKISANGPLTPPNLTAVAGDGWIGLGWEHTPGVDGYNVYRSTTGGYPYTLIATVDGFYYADTGLTNGVTYTYVVTAVNIEGESPYSNSAQATPYAGGPTTVTITVPGTDVPTGTFTTTVNGTTVIIVVSVSGGNTVIVITPFYAPADVAAYATGSGKITLYWSGVSGATGYNIYRGTAAGGEDYANPVNGATPVTTLDTGPGVTNMYMYSDNNSGLGLTDGTEYFYTIKAVDGSTLSGASNEDSDTPDSTAIAWDTGDPAQIVPEISQMVANNLTPNEAEVGVLAIAGPDGVVYQGNYPNGDPPVALAALGQYNSSSNTIDYTDGTSTPAPPLDDDSENNNDDLMSPDNIADAYLLGPLAAGPPLTPHYGYAYPAKNPTATGIFRKVESQPGQYGLESFITLPDPGDTNAYDHSSADLFNGDAAYIYTGGAVWNYAASREEDALDVGLQLNSGTTGWRPFILPKRTPRTIYLGSPTIAQINNGKKIRHVYVVVLPDADPFITFEAPGYGTVKNKIVSLTVTGHVLATYFDRTGALQQSQSVQAATFVYAGVQGWTKKASLMIKRTNSIGQIVPNNAGNGPGGGFNKDASFVYGANWGEGWSNATLYPGGEMDQSLIAKEGSYPTGPSASGYLNWLEQSAFSWEQNINLRTSTSIPFPIY